MKFKKLISYLLAATMTLAALPTVQAADLGIDPDSSVKAAVGTNTENSGEPLLSGNMLPEQPIAGSSIIRSSSSNLVYGSDGSITRAEWLHDLSVVFDMQVEEDNYPDNYFSDLSSENKYYYDILLTVEFGVIHIEAGENLYPDEPVTRAFAAQTLNYCLGYILDENAEYTFKEKSDPAYADCLKDFQIAVDHGWFSLSDGAFMPMANVTSEEARLMLDDAADILESSNNVSSEKPEYSFADYVIEFSKETKAEIDENDTVTIYNAEKTLSAGDTFVIYLVDQPLIFVAKEIKINGDKTIVTTGPADLSAIVTANGSHMIDMNMMQFIPAEGVTASYSTDNAQSSSEIMPLSINPVSDTIDVTTEVDVGNGVSVKVFGSISNIVYCDNVSISGATVYVSGDTKFGAQLDVDILKLVGGTKSITLGKFVYGFGLLTVELTVDIDLSGKIVAVHEGAFQIGASVDSRGFRTITNFYKKSFSVCAEVNADIALTATCKVNILVASLTLSASTGIHATISSTTISDGKLPMNCTTVKAYLYAKASIKGHLLSEKGNWTLTIWNEQNSPCKLSIHFDDGVQVDKCGRNSKLYTSPSSTKFGGAYSSKASSKWYGGSNSGNISAEHPEVLWLYELKSDKTAVITGYNGYASTIVIPSEIDGYKVSAIGAKAFKGKKGLIMAVIPSTVKEIGEQAFADCSSLLSAAIPEDVVRVFPSTFSNCTSLTSVIIPDTVTEIGTYAFSGCTSLNSVRLPSRLTTLGQCAFAECTSLTSINIPKKLETVITSGTGAFRGCSALKKIEFEEGISKIAANLFKDCDGLEEVIIPDTVTRVEDWAFSSCESLQKVTISDSVTAIGQSAFGNCTALTTVIFSDSVAEIGNGAFGKCTLLNGIKLPSQLVSLGDGVFSNCTSLTSINIPKKLEKGNRVFANCSNLKKIEFEKGVTKIVDFLFRDCSGLEEIVIPDTVTEIGRWTFLDCQSLKKVTIPDSVTVIYDMAFSGCTMLSDIKLPSELITLGSDAFSDCSSLEEISIPDTVTFVGGSCFSGCTSLRTVKLPNTISSIEDCCFMNCSSLETIDIPDTVEIFKNAAFNNCTSLTAVNFSEKSALTELYDCFHNCEMLKEIILPENVGYIGAQTFLNCSSLAKVYIPKSVKTIGKNAFEGCSSLTDLTISDGSIEKIENETFRDCSSLESVTLPKGLKSIGKYAFMSNVKLTSVTIPPSVTEIDSTAFSYPGKMTIYGYEGTYAEEFAKQEEITFVPLKKIPFDKLTVELGETFEYTGGQITPDISVFENDYQLTEDQEYTVTYGENIKIGKGTVTITLIGPMYEGTKTVEFSIVPADINSAKYTPSDNKFTYFGKDLVEGVDYTVEYVYDLDAMCTDMIFTGIGNFTGKHTVYSYSTANPLCSFENGASDFAFDDVLERWRMDFSIADQSVWSKVDRIEAVIFSEGGFVNGCIGYKDMSGKWQKADFERQYGSYGYYTFSAKNVGGLISGPDEYGNEMGNLCFQLWWIEKYTNFYLTSITLYDKEGKVLVRLPELKNYLVYETDKNNEVSVLGASLASETEPEIPAEIGGNTVTSIGEKAFAGKSGLASVTIPLTVTQIAKNAFDGRSEQFAIRGYVDSYAKTYADENNIPFIPIKDLSDKDHGVGLEDTEELIPDGAELVVEEVKSSEDGQTTVYDITLVDGSGAEVEPDGDVLVIIDLPQKWANVDKVYVYYCTENGTLVDMNAYISNGYIMFTTSHFSQYMLTTKNQTTVKLGDVDGNGKINSVDARWVLQAISGKRTLTAEQQAAADVNNDGKINTADAKWILQDVSGKRELE